MPSRHLPLAAILAAAGALAACSAPEPTPPDELACADPAALSRVNFRPVVVREGDSPYPGADLLDDGSGGRITVRRRVAISGRHIREVRSGFSAQKGIPSVTILLEPEGVKELAKALGRSPDSGGIALVVDGAVTPTPYYSSSVEAGVIELFGPPSARDAEALATRIAKAARGCVKPPAGAAA